MANSGRRGGRGVILDGAVRRFSAVGYHGASTRDIAAESGVTAAAIYHHFDSKQDILAEVMTRVLSSVIDQTRRAVLASGATPGDQLDALVRTWVLFHISHQDEARVGASEIRSLSSNHLAAVVALRDEQEALFRAVVERGVSEGDFATPHPVEAARAIVGMGRAVADWYRAGGPMPPNEVAATYVDLARAVVRQRS